MRYHYPQSTGWIPPEASGSGWSPMPTRSGDDNQVVILGVNEVNTNPFTPCNCLIGTPVVDASGNCTCVSEAVPTKPIYLDGKPAPVRLPPVIVEQNPQPATQPTQPVQTLVEKLTANPLILIGGVIAAIYLFKK